MEQLQVTKYTCHWSPGQSRGRDYTEKVFEEVIQRVPVLVMAG